MAKASLRENRDPILPTAPGYAAALGSAARMGGAWIEDRTGRRWLDLVNQDGAVILGWGDQAVESAVADAGPDLARLEAAAAARLAARSPLTESAVFYASLSCAMGGALLAAKAVTGRDGAFICSDQTVLRDDRPALAEAVGRHVGDLAALVVRPLDASRPFLVEARRLASQAGALLIFEESRSAFRVHALGAEGLTGVRPDLVVYGPSLANGRPLAAVAGPRELLRGAERIGPRPAIASVAAAVATLDRLTRVDAPQALAVRGAEIEAETLALFARYGVERLFSLNGDPCWSVVTGARPGLNDALAAALHARGVLSFGAHVPSLATEDRDIAHLLQAYAGALPTLAERFAA